MKIEYEIKGITLDVNDLMKVHEYYEAACTAEYLMDNYGIDNEEDALQLGYDVRWLMYKYDLDEETAIDRALEKIIEYLEREFCWLEQSGVFLQNARILDDDDKYDKKAIWLVDQIFKEE